MAVVESVGSGLQTVLPGSNQAAIRYDLVILDSSSSYHATQDTRYLYPQSAQPFEADRGLGRGTMRFYADPQSGAVLGYKWSTGSASTCRPDQRKVVLGRLTKK
ncbi:MAG: hypothetical protein IGS03_01465 [Candidatus Sericytochromatia bacterium]|nr:hypothetical protein [Candidatus Sericytochromatia bacterium]